MTNRENATDLAHRLAPGADDAPAIAAPERMTLSHGGLRRLIGDTVARLNALGIGRGDRVAIVLPNGPEMAMAFIAVAAAASTAPLNPAYKEDEFRFYIEDTEARVLLLPAEGADAARRAAGDRVPVMTVAMDAAGVVSVAGTPRRAPVTPPSVEDVALILHTSGSTGRR